MADTVASDRRALRTVLILTNGGDTCALNASIKSIRDSVYSAGIKKIYGARRGYQGLFDGWIEDITRTAIDVTIGGSFLGSQRFSPVHRPDGEKKYKVDQDVAHIMARKLAEYEVDVLIVIGGDGTLQATAMFQKWVFSQRDLPRPFEIIGFLKTIDNDVKTETAFEGIEACLTPGYPSAVRKVVDATEGLRVTATTAERAFIVETMGRDAGWLAAATAFGGAEIILIPEIRTEIAQRIQAEAKVSGTDRSAASIDQEIDADVMQRLISRVFHFYHKNRNVLIGSSEGFTLPAAQPQKWKEFEETTRSIFGTRKKVGVSELLANLVQRFAKPYFDALSKGHDGLLKDEALAAFVKAIKTALGPDLKDVYGMNDDALSNMAQGMGPREPPLKFEMRPHRTDYLPRSGEPSPYDYRLASVLGARVGLMLAEFPPQFGYIPCMSRVVPYEDLTPAIVKLVPIQDVGNQDFRMSEFFDLENLTVTDRFIRFLKTILTGPPQHKLREAIHETDQMLDDWRRKHVSGRKGID